MKRKATNANVLPTSKALIGSLFLSLLLITTKAQNHVVVTGAGLEEANGIYTFAGTETFSGQVYPYFILPGTSFKIGFNYNWHEYELYHIGNGQALYFSFHPPTQPGNLPPTSDWFPEYGVYPIPTFTLVTNPTFEVSGNGELIPNNSTTTQTSNNTNFGNLTVGGVATNYFTYYNKGLEPLTIDNVDVMGDVSEFTVTPRTGTISPRTGTLPIYNYSTFWIDFHPNSPGTKTISLSIYSNDPLVPIYTYMISGEAVAPCLPVTSGGIIGYDQSVCAGQMPQLLENAQSASGGSGDIQYKWQLSTQNATTGFVDIPGANSASYLHYPSYQTSYLRRLARSGCDNWNNAAYSNTVTITIEQYLGTQPAGSGTQADPYQISSFENLLWISESNLRWDKNYVQTADIDATATADICFDYGFGFSPIGNPTTPFTGSYDGNENEISNLYINRTTNEFIGLFGYIGSGGSIQNLGLTNVNVRGGNRTGALAGESRGNITNCFVTGEIRGEFFVGGLLGVLDSQAVLSHSYASAEVQGSQSVGGLAGYTYGTVNQCYSIGGSVLSNSIAGGLIGYTYESTIQNCYATTPASVTEEIVGGLAGLSIFDTYENSYAVGQIIGSSNTGGLIGLDNYGFPSSIFNHCFWDTETTGQSTSAGGTPKSTLQMKLIGTYLSAGWEIRHDNDGNIWGIVDPTLPGTTSYPYLKNNLQDPKPGLQPAIAFVKADASGNNSGSNWENAINNLQDAIDLVDEHFQVWVAAGTYLPTSIPQYQSGERSRSFVLKNAVPVYGGFAGNEDPASFDLSDRDFETNETILSGDFNGDDDYSSDPWTGMEENAYHVVFNNSYGINFSKTYLDGFTISGGNANAGSTPNWMGGGILIENNTMELNNLKVENNRSSYHGAGLFLSNSSVVLTNSFIQLNKQNNAGSSGGGIYSLTTKLNIKNVLIAQNNAFVGAGISLINNSNTFIINSTITNNEAINTGGGIYNQGSLPEIYNSILWANNSQSGKQHYNNGGSSTFHYSIIQNQDNDIFGSITEDNTLYDDPLFVDPENADFRISALSPARDAGLNPGNNSGTDIRGAQRIQNGTIDIGPYEYTQGVDPDCIPPSDGGLISENQTICANSTPGLLMNNTPPTGFSGNLQYQWQSSTTSDSESFTNITDAISASYQPEALSVTTWYKRIAWVDCDATNPIASNVVQITVDPTTVAGTVNGPAEITYGNALQLNLDGQVGTVIKWQKKLNTNDWEDIAYTGTDYSETLQTAGSWSYRTFVQSGSCNEEITENYTVIVNPKQLAIADPNLTLSKVYDATTNAAVVAGLLSGVESGDVVNVSATANYDDELVGIDKQITVVYSLSGADALNYIAPANFISNSGEITAKQLAITDPALTLSKTYDATTAANVLAGELSGMESGDVVNVAADANYETPNVGTDKQITVVYSLSGADALNYIAPVDFVVNNGIITAKQLVIADPDLTLSKTYDATTNAAVVAGVLSGVESGDLVSVSALADYDTPNVATDKQITVVYSLSGADALNYNAPANFISNSGKITAKQLAIADPGLTLSKVYDATTTAAVVAGALSGVESGDLVSVSALADYDTPNVAIDKQITVVYSLSGADALNYTAPVDYVVNNGIITAKQLTIADPDLTLSKTYDATTNAGVVAGALSGVENGDVVNVLALADYDNPNLDKPEPNRNTCNFTEWNY